MSGLATCHPSCVLLVGRGDSARSALLEVKSQTVAGFVIVTGFVIWGHSERAVFLSIEQAGNPVELSHRIF